MKNLLSPPTPDCLEGQEDIFRAVLRAVPVPASRAADLPYAVRDLSRLLTREREGLRRSYWSAPRFLSAYAHFFLPWNVHRLSWLLPGLDLPLADGDRVLDLGSGPLTLPLALWCARPELRQKRLHFVCTDSSQSPLDAGKRIFDALGLPPGWRLECRRAGLDIALSASDFALITAGNVLNELPPPRRGDEEQRLAGLLGRMARALSPKGRLLLVEPGTRHGGRTVALARKAALEAGCSVAAPCTHENPCPMLEQGRYTPGRPAPSGWCHFIHPPRPAPARLTDLGRAAGLEKEALALACLLLLPGTAAGPDGATPGPSGPPGADDLDELEALYLETMANDEETDDADADQPAGAFSARAAGQTGAPGRRPPSFEPALPPLPGPQPLRVISGLIRLPGETEAARYACGPSGLCLLPDAARIPSGAGVEAAPEADFRRDSKTGALIVQRKTFAREAGRDRETDPRPRRGGRPDRK